MSFHRSNVRSRTLRARHVHGVAFTLALAAAAACSDAPTDSLSGAADPHGDQGQALASPPQTNEGAATVTHSLAPKYELGTAVVAYAAPLADKLQAEIAKTGTVTVARASAAFPASLQAVHAKYGVTAVTPLLAPSSASPAALTSLRATYAKRTSRALTTTTMPRLDAFFVVRFDPTAAVDEVVQALGGDASVTSAEANRFATLATINDPFGAPAYDWGLYKVAAPTAWSASMGAGAVVATIDTGAMAAHTDLAANILPGYDYFNGDTNPDDDNAHGTHVAGIIAAIVNNNSGVTGVAPSAKILPVKAFGAYGQGGSTTVLANSLMYAMMQNVDVINNSWAGAGRSAIIENLFKTAESLGIVSVSAAGNNNDQASNYYPANIEYSITVAASDVSDAKSSFSNFGVKVDVAAPGGAATSAYATDILSTVPGFYAGAGTLTATDGSKYAPFAGTSMATPFVSGLAALLVAQHPTWTVEQIKQAIRKGSTDVGTAGFDTSSGYGRILASGSTSIALAPPSAALDKPLNGDTVEGTALLDGFALPSPAHAANYTVYAGAGATPTAWTAMTTAASANVTDNTLGYLDTLNLADGATTLRLVTTDTTGGQVAEDRNLVTVNNVYITTPVAGQILTAASLNVIGKAMGNLGFANYTLAWAPGNNATAGFTTFTTSTTQKPAGSNLGGWNISAIPDGPVTLRLAAQFGTFVTTKTVNVIIDHHLLPGWPAPVNLAPSFKSPKIVDLDHNGIGEVVYGASVYDATGLVRPGWTSSPGLGRSNPAIVNIDATTDLEVLPIEMGAYYYDASLVNGGAPIAKAYKHNKAPIWSYPVVNPASPYANGIPSSVSIGDVDGDAKLEAVFSVFFVYNNPTNATTVFVLDAATGVLRHTFNVAGQSLSSIAIANIDGVGKADLVLDSYVPGTASGMVHVVTGAGVPLAGWPQTFTASIEGYGNMDPVVGDSDRDCKYDILVGQRLFKRDGTLFTGWPMAYLSRSTGAFANIDTDAAHELITGSANMVLTWAMDPNATLKFWAPDQYGENLYVLGAGENYMRGNPIMADLDGNGRAEVLRGAELGNTAPNVGLALYDLDSLAGANQSAYQRFLVTSAPGDTYSYPIYSSSAVGDLDGDGKLDLAIAGGGKIYVWGMGSAYVPASNPWPMFQHDLNNTGAGPVMTGITCAVGPGPIPTSSPL